MKYAKSAEVMAEIDRMSADFRALVYEFGFSIVAAMMNDGYDNATELRSVLETWRERRQQQWLGTNYIGQSVKDSFAAAM